MIAIARPAVAKQSSRPAQGVYLGRAACAVGVIGASNIGRRVIERLATLDVDIAVADPYLDDAGAESLGARRMDVDDLFPWADVVTVHAPALPSTEHLVNADRLATMHDGVWLVNTAWGSIVDTDVLTASASPGGSLRSSIRPNPSRSRRSRRCTTCRTSC